MVEVWGRLCSFGRTDTFAAADLMNHVLHHSEKTPLLSWQSWRALKLTVWEDCWWPQSDQRGA